MNIQILQPLPQDPIQRQAFIDTWQQEVRVYRKQPSFIIGMVMAALSALTLMALTEGIFSRLVILVGVFGVAFVYDTVTRHFCARLLTQHQPAGK